MDKYSLLANSSVTTINNVTFQDMSSKRYKNQIRLEYDEDLNGLESDFNFFTTEVASDKKVYDSWNFTSSEDWDYFWYHKNNSQIFNMVDFTIGNETCEIAPVPATLDTTIHKSLTPEVSILGIGITYSDI